MAPPKFHTRNKFFIRIKLKCPSVTSTLTIFHHTDSPHRRCSTEGKTQKTNEEKLGKLRRKKSNSDGEQNELNYHGSMGEGWRKEGRFTYAYKGRYIVPWGGGGRENGKEGRGERGETFIQLIQPPLR